MSHRLTFELFFYDETKNLRASTAIVFTLNQTDDMSHYLIIEFFNNMESGGFSEITSDF
jgi:hypothetical protein